MVDLRALDKLLDIIAPDSVMGSSAMGVPEYVRARMTADATGARMVELGLEALEVGSLDLFKRSFSKLDTTPALKVTESVSICDWFNLLTRWAAEAIYADPDNGGNPNSLSWEEIGYRHGLPEGPSGPPLRPPPTLKPSTLKDRYDIIVVGGGAGGGIVAGQLALDGLEVLMVERGNWLSYEDSGRRDHLRNHRNPVYGHNTGPEDLDGFRISVRPDGLEQLVQPHSVEYGGNAACVGSGTLVYGGMAWRLSPDDFRMASRYGVPAGSSLVDWPIGYDELEPWYTMAEQEIGVSGEPGRLPHEPWRSLSLPMPAMPKGRTAIALQAGAEKLGITTLTPPLLVNSRPIVGRAACIHCGSCVGFPCPTGAKNGTQNTILPKALATGRLTVITDTVVDRLDLNAAGEVVGVKLTWRDANNRKFASVAANMVVLAAGAIETARLLLLSPHSGEPRGVGNNNDLVGRNLQGHTYASAYGIFDEEIYASEGPGVTIGTADFAHGNEDIIGGAMLADDFVILPIIFWDLAMPPEVPRWGQAPHDFMRKYYRHVTQVKGPVHEIPSANCRVELDRLVTDQWGRPVARLSGVVHPETTRAAEYLLQKAKNWLSAAGAKSVWGSVPAPQLSSYQHQAGTCRMGTSPRNSVTDLHGRVWGHSNLFVADASLHPTNGGFNPVLTIMALAFRCANHIIHRAK